MVKPLRIYVVALLTDTIEVETDEEGISTSSLRSILESWPSDKPKPKVLYTVPVSS